MKTISIVNMKGGVAKTTLAVNIADCLVRRHDLKVLLIDIDPQFNATQCLLSGDDYVQKCKEGQHTIVHLFEDAPRPSVASVNGAKMLKPVKIEDITPWKIKNNFHLIPGALELYRLVSCHRNQFTKFCAHKIPATCLAFFIFLSISSP